jgi:hypothetical protein
VFRQSNSARNKSAAITAYHLHLRIYGGFSDAAIQFCLTMKVLFKIPLWQTTGMVASLLKMANLDWAVPDYTTLCRRQKTLAVQIPYRRANGPLNLLVTSHRCKQRLPGNGQHRDQVPR